MPGLLPGLYPGDVPAVLSQKYDRVYKWDIGTGFPFWVLVL